jgi:hypothetical protein
MCRLQSKAFRSAIALSSQPGANERFVAKDIHRDEDVIIIRPSGFDQDNDLYSDSPAGVYSIRRHITHYPFRQSRKRQILLLLDLVTNAVST